jgi:hypothetical protein
VFVTTAARYADAVPWELLHTAQRRGTALAVVCNRVPPPAMREVMDHLGQMLAEGGLSRAALFGVPEVALDRRVHPGPGGGAAAGLAARTGRGRRRPGRGGPGDPGRRVAQHVRAGAGAGPGRGRIERGAAVLLEDADVLYAAAVRDVDDGVRGGTVLRGEVLARWQEFVGTGELLRGLQSRVGRIRDRVASAFTGRPLPDEEVADAVESSVESLVRAAATGRRSGPRRPGGAGRAARRCSARPVRCWPARPRTSPSGCVPRSGPGRATCSTWCPRRAPSGRTAARMASFGVNGAGLAVMLLVFAQTGGLTGPRC